MTRALVIGCASGVWDEVRAAQELAAFDAVYCVKMAGIHWYGSRFTWVGLHPEFAAKYSAERDALGLHHDYETVAPLICEIGEHAKHEVDRRVAYRWPGMNASASSGIYAAKVALEDGHSRVVLCGVPMSDDAGHFLPNTKGVHGNIRGHVWRQCQSFMTGFEQSVPHLLGKVKSMSGRTRDALGYPTKEWLEG